MYDAGKYFATNTVYFLTTGNRYLLSILNSKTVNFYYKLKASGLGDHANRAFKFIYINIPIPSIVPSEQKPFITLTHRIIELKESSHKTNELEAQIDQMVYNLYNLTPDEIKFIEEKLS